MNIEYEATFIDINKDDIRDKLRSIGAKLIKPEFMQKRHVFSLPKNHKLKNGWVRVRDEGDKITMSLKDVGSKIHEQKEARLVVNDYNEAVTFIEKLGFPAKAYQESLRELWVLGGVEITIDTWPFLDPIVEVEGVSEEAVKTVSKELGFNWSQAKFCSADTLYKEKYNISEDIVNNHTPKLIFEMKNPFVK
ncbi:CYTH domain-containing protein [bacterium]|nr:CYTH domain-containing protein [bacterium]